MKKIVFGLLLLFATNTFAQYKFEMFPDDLTIQPFTANFLEPKLGMLFMIDENEIRLDIGNSVDALRFEYDDNTVLSFGLDLFTYTRLRAERDFHFPVDAVDYLFGFNAGWKKINKCSEIGARLRLSHISAHFADGHYDGSNQRWLDYDYPIVYSREFLEFIGYYKFSDLRVYAGMTYIFHVDPSDLGKNIYHLGLDYFMKDKIGGSVSPFFGYDLRLENLYAYTPNHSVEAGIKFGKAGGKGLKVYLQYFSGKSVHGEYFDWNKQFAALGVNVDL